MAMSDEELLHGFTSTELPVEQFHHQQHVRVAWLFVRHHGMPSADQTMVVSQAPT